MPGTQLELAVRGTDGTWENGIVIDNAATSGSKYVGFYNSIDLDEAGYPSFAYLDAYYQVPMLADLVSDPFLSLVADAVITPVDYNYWNDIGEEMGWTTNCTTGLYTDILIDSIGYNNVVYYDGCDLADEAQLTRLGLIDYSLDFDELKWSETVAPQGVDLDIEEGLEGALCMSHRDQSTDALMYGCSLDGGDTWEHETVDDSGSVGHFADMAITSKGIAHIAYYDATYGRVYLASQGSGSWDILELGEVGDYPKYTTTPIRIAVDADDIVHVVYFDANTWTIGHAIGG
jgi:hypothetical protein